ncbi:MAG: 4-(cytidine 5'-diphospho)-2-C-methyl-D-erythritol kinase [Gammaproteobacteria bacterium]
MISKNWPAPAKLNLFLHITGRRQDGYHLLQTVFQFIDLVDDIEFQLTTDGALRRLSAMPGVAEEDDLVIRAARLLQEHSGSTHGVDIKVNKRIPEGGGLGGGSSDAATTLVALNELWQTGLEPSQLAEIGLSLGADVPIFIYGRAAWAEGVGEQLSPVEPAEVYYLVIHPGCSVPTAAIFNAPDLTRNTPPITIRDFFDRGGINDCEAVVRKQYPEVNAAIDWLNQFAPTRLTGTGACVFAGFEDESSAQAAREQLPATWRGFLVRGVNRSPLQARLAEERNAAN